ncbi:multivesicular body subunit 12B [Anabrus simplex]|uniref:multivesicular body subunit 12B n=1 Tax=Anabrus simplex TaxID=316456 RepID=UPI0034DCCFFF
MMHQVYKSLPDDRPITSIHIIEDPEKVPPGFVVVSRTHDQDSDADLWREGWIFGRKATRYLCLSKTEGIADYIVETVIVINEKETPPDGFSVLVRTADTEQRAWRKKQLCYKLSKPIHAKQFVTDIIVLSRTKRNPDGFTLAGEINGMTICFKCKKNSVESETKPLSPSQLSYSLNPYPNAAPPVPARLPPQPPSQLSKPLANGVAYPLTPADTSPHEYERLLELRPSRPAPKPPGSGSPARYATIAVHHGLEGVPFVLNSSFLGLPDGNTFQIPIIKAKTKYQLDKEYNYDFRIERQT